MFDTTVSSGGRELISAGCALSFSGQPVELKVTQNELEFLTLIFVFRIPEDGKGGNCPRMETRSIGLRTLEIVVSDFDNPYGCGTAEPVSVAANGRNRVYLHFRVFGLPRADKLLLYNLYLERDQA